MRAGWWSSVAGKKEKAGHRLRCRTHQVLRSHLYLVLRLRLFLFLRVADDERTDKLELLAYLLVGGSTVGDQAGDEKNEVG